MVDLGQSGEEGIYSFPTKNGGFWTKAKTHLRKRKRKIAKYGMANKKQTKNKRKKGLYIHGTT